MSRKLDKLTIYSDAGADRQYGLRALAAAAQWPDSRIIGFTYGEPVHTCVDLRRNKAGVTVWVYRA